MFFLGAITNREVYSFINLSSMIVSLYESSNIGNPFFEAMSVGCLFIAVNNGDTSNFVEHLGNGYLLFESDIVNELNMFFKVLSKNETLIDELAFEARKYSESLLLSWSERMEKESSLIKKLSDNRWSE